MTSLLKFALTTAVLTLIGLFIYYVMGWFINGIMFFFWLAVNGV